MGEEEVAGLRFIGPTFKAVLAFWLQLKTIRFSTIGSKYDLEYVGWESTCWEGICMKKT